MAAGPQYGKQYIRFAETALVADNLAIPQFSVVADSGAGTDPTSITNVIAAPGEVMGVLQQEFNLATSGFATDLLRLGTVATSGLLLVAMDAVNAVAIGDALTVNATGQAATGGSAVTVNGTAPQVRQLVTIGGTSFALVSFA